MSYASVRLSSNIYCIIFPHSMILYNSWCNGKCRFQTHSYKRLHHILLIIIDHGENTLDNHRYRAYAERKVEDHNYNCKNWHSAYLTVQLISLESVTCEASTQRTHLTILAEVWHGFDTPGHILIMIASWCTAYHLRFPRNRPESVENPLQRVWSFLFKFYLKNHKYEGISAKKQEWSMQKWETKLNPEREKQAYHKLLYGCFCVCFLHILPCSHFCFLSLNPLNKEVHLSAFDRRQKMYYSFIIFSNPYVRWLTIHQRYELAPKFREQVIEAIKFSCTGTKGVNHSPIRTRPRCNGITNN